MKDRVACLLLGLLAAVAHLLLMPFSGEVHAWRESLGAPAPFWFSAPWCIAGVILGLVAAGSSAARLGPRWRRAALVLPLALAALQAAAILLAIMPAAG